MLLGVLWLCFACWVSDAGQVTPAPPPPLPTTADGLARAVYEAVILSEQRETLRLLENGAEPDGYRGAYGETALIQAAGMGHTGLTRMLVEWGASVVTKDRQGFTALHRALRNGQSTAARALIDMKQVDLESRDNRGATPLHRACQSPCHRHCVPALLKKHVNVHARNNQGWTPLHACARYGRPSYALLLDAGAELDPVDDEGFTPLLRAAQFGHDVKIRTVAEELVGRGARLDMQTHANETAWDLAGRQTPDLARWIQEAANDPTRNSGSAKQEL
jgi:ankyrin repeat protein